MVVELAPGDADSSKAEYNASGVNLMARREPCLKGGNGWLMCWC